MTALGGTRVGLQPFGTTRVMVGVALGMGRGSSSGVGAEFGDEFAHLYNLHLLSKQDLTGRAGEGLSDGLALCTHSPPKSL